MTTKYAFPNEKIAEMSLDGVGLCKIDSAAHIEYLSFMITVVTHSTFGMLHYI